MPVRVTPPSHDINYSDTSRKERTTLVQKRCLFWDWKINGRGERIRTSDLTVPNRALYQAEPRPDINGLDDNTIEAANGRALSANTKG